MHEYDVAVLIPRVLLALIMFMHGKNHWRGPGGVQGTARWFGGIGLQPAIVHAWMSVVIEFAAAAGFLLGLFNPLACTATVAVMTVAGIAEHRKNGFFVFKEGYEYVLYIAGTCVALGILGPGKYSLDRALGIDDNLDGWTGGGIALLGVLGAAAMLAVCWRPEKKPAPAT
ncbi:MAG: putative oxidoreductase [Actinomycetota bacterium]|nr:putative oxidoreductase [Actinomycetota bacterium]